YPDVHLPSQEKSEEVFHAREVAPILSTEEPKHSLSMGYEHLSITSETESDEVTVSNAKNLLPIPSECEVTSEDESECDVPAKDDSSPAFTTFSNPFFIDNDDLDSSNDESLPDEDVSVEEFKVYSNPLFDEDEIRIVSMSNLILLNLYLIVILLLILLINLISLVNSLISIQKLRNPMLTLRKKSVLL
nr:hypothetical protein [Tanacetum cinerariifolium]